MKITAISVTDEKGVVHTWEGIEGWVRIRNQSYKNQDYQESLDAHLLLTTKPDVHG